MKPTKSWHNFKGIYLSAPDTPNKKRASATPSKNASTTFQQTSSYSSQAEPVFLHSFFSHRLKRFWNHWKKLSHFSQNVWKHKLTNTVMVSFNTTMRKMTKMFQQKWPKCFSEKKKAELTVTYNNLCMKPPKSWYNLYWSAPDTPNKESALFCHSLLLSCTF